jgi:hypothetical protein
MLVLSCILIMLAIALPLHWAVQYELERWESPDYFRRYGVVVKRPEALDAAAEVIGTYCGAAVHRSVTFKGMTYEFAGVVSQKYQDASTRTSSTSSPGSCTSPVGPDASRRSVAAGRPGRARVARDGGGP